MGSLLLPVSGVDPLRHVPDGVGVVNRRPVLPKETRKVVDEVEVEPLVVRHPCLSPVVVWGRSRVKVDP